MAKIFNPLDHVEIPVLETSVSKSQPLKSTSSLYNEKVGICPKCGVSMSKSTVDGEEVFYCSKDRVVLPLPDSQS
jgi:hypothetical protein